jgi:hypothetical protein
MSRAQFRKALKARGMRDSLLWIELPAARPDGTIGLPHVSGISIGMVVDMKGVVNRRASLARAIRALEKETA